MEADEDESEGQQPQEVEPVHGLAGSIQVSTRLKNIHEEFCEYYTETCNYITSFLRNLRMGPTC